jgi:hypothetical protein
MSTWDDHSLLVTMQGGLATANTTDAEFFPIKGGIPKVAFNTEVTELELMTGVVGAGNERLVGSRRGTIGFSMPLEGLVSGYDPTSEDPGGTPVGLEVMPLWFLMLANAMGSNSSAIASVANFVRGLGVSVSQYTSGGMLSGTASAITCDNATASDKIDVGQLVVAALSATSLVPQIGFAKTEVGQVVTLFEAAKNNVNDAAAHLYGTGTAYASSEITSTQPLGFRWVGPATESCYDLIGAYCSSAKITWNRGEVPTIEFAYSFYDFEINKADGGLQVPGSYARIPQIVGSNNGYVTIDTAQKCGLESCTWEWAAGELRENGCHGADNGVTSISVLKPRVKMSFNTLYDTADAVLDAAGGAATIGQHRWQAALELGSRVSVGVYVGSVVGKIFALLMPSGVISAAPQISMRGEQVAYQIELEAGSYTADSTDTAETSADSPLDSIARVGLG